MPKTDGTDANAEGATPPAPAATGDTQPKAGDGWKPIKPLTAADVKALRNERNGDLTRWNPAIGRTHLETATDGAG